MKNAVLALVTFVLGIAAGSWIIRPFIEWLVEFFSAANC